MPDEQSTEKSGNSGDTGYVDSEIAALAHRVATARGKLPLQHDTALVDVLSEDEITAERELAEWIRAQRRGQRRRAVEAEIAAEKRDRRTTAAIRRTDEEDAHWHRRALAARRRVASQDARLAQLYRRAEWSSRVLIGVVVLGMIWAGVNVQHNLVPSGDMTDPLYWLSYGIEAMISIPIITIMVVATTAARWGRELPRGKVAVFEAALLGTTVALNTGPHLSAGHWGKAAEFAIAPVMVGVVIWLHAWVAARYAQLIDSVPVTDAVPVVGATVHGQVRRDAAPGVSGAVTREAGEPETVEELLLSSIPLKPLTNGLSHTDHGRDDSSFGTGGERNGHAVSGHTRNGGVPVVNGTAPHPGRGRNGSHSGLNGSGLNGSGLNGSGKGTNVNGVNGTAPHPGRGRNGSHGGIDGGGGNGTNGGTNGNAPSARWAERRSAFAPEIVAISDVRPTGALRTARANGRTVRTPNGRVAHSPDDSVPHPAGPVTGRAATVQADGSVPDREVHTVDRTSADERPSSDLRPESERRIDGDQQPETGRTRTNSGRHQPAQTPDPRPFRDERATTAASEPTPFRPVGRGTGSVTSLAHERAARLHARTGHPAGTALARATAPDLDPHPAQTPPDAPRLVPVTEEPHPTDTRTTAIETDDTHSVEVPGADTPRVAPNTDSAYSAKVSETRAPRPAQDTAAETSPSDARSAIAAMDDAHGEEVPGAGAGRRAPSTGNAHSVKVSDTRPTRTAPGTAEETSPSEARPTTTGDAHGVEVPETHAPAITAEDVSPSDTHATITRDAHSVGAPDPHALATARGDSRSDAHSGGATTDHAHGAEVLDPLAPRTVAATDAETRAVGAHSAAIASAPSLRHDTASQDLPLIPLEDLTTLGIDTGNSLTESHREVEPASEHSVLDTDRSGEHTEERRGRKTTARDTTTAGDAATRTAGRGQGKRATSRRTAAASARTESEQPATESTDRPATSSRATRDTARDDRRRAESESTDHATKSTRTTRDTDRRRTESAAARTEKGTDTARRSESRKARGAEVDSAPDSGQLTLEADPGPEPRHPRITLDAIAAARDAAGQSDRGNTEQFDRDGAERFDRSDTERFDRDDMIEPDIGGDGDIEIWSVARAICDRGLSRLPVEQVAEVLTLADQSWTPMGIGSEVGIPTSSVIRILEAVAKVRRPLMG